MSYMKSEFIHYKKGGSFYMIEYEEMTLLS